MTIRIGINGFGRMGRLVMRVAAQWDDICVVHINDPAGNADSLAHLLNFDSVHGRWQREATAIGDELRLGNQTISTSRNQDIGQTESAEKKLKGVWQDIIDKHESKKALSVSGFKDPEKILRLPGADSEIIGITVIEHFCPIDLTIQLSG